MLKLGYLLFALMFLPSALTASQSDHRCIDDFIRFMTIVDEVGKGNPKFPTYCRPEWIDAGRPILYTRYCDDDEKIAVRAAIVISEKEPFGMRCDAGLDYGGYPSSDCSSDYPMDVNYYPYEERERFLEARALIKEICLAIGSER